ncbi:hypothetical protein AVEN_101727-1 [Araneus ventricosus]|uniref:Uncharacterized protein n=1 Tax=Araneus ventricosus TaxID=182803 RepID=A0A4Y2QFD7_ARAVE|nr:hypothetical protein AVEN_101727-1 [Araneus ventricosus]
MDISLALHETPSYQSNCPPKRTSTESPITQSIGDGLREGKLRVVNLVRTTLPDPICDVNGPCGHSSFCKIDKFPQEQHPLWETCGGPTSQLADDSVP